MTTVSLLRRQTARRHPEHRSLRRAAFRIVVALVVVGAGIATIVLEQQMRHLEAAVSARLVGLFFADAAVYSPSGAEAAFAFSTSDDRWFGLRITIQCAIALYVGPILILGGLMSSLTRLPLVRVLGATALAVVLMVTLNQVRFVLLAVVLATWGHDAFDWAHSLGGSFLMLFGLAASLFLFFRIIMGAVRPPRTDGAA